MHHVLSHDTDLEVQTCVSRLSYEKPRLMELAASDGIVRGISGYDMGGGTQGEDGNYNWGGEEATTEE